MAKFRNVDKRRPWESPQQKRRKKTEESRWIEAHKSKMISLRIGKVIGDIREGKRIDPVDYSYIMGERPPSLSANGIQPMRSVKKETWAEFFGLRLYRFQKWFVELWITGQMGRFQNSRAQLTRQNIASRRG